MGPGPSLVAPGPVPSPLGKGGGVRATTGRRPRRRGVQVLFAVEWDAEVFAGAPVEALRDGFFPRRCDLPLHALPAAPAGRVAPGHDRAPGAIGQLDQSGEVLIGVLVAAVAPP